MSISGAFSSNTLSTISNAIIGGNASVTGVMDSAFSPQPGQPEALPTPVPLPEPVPVPVRRDPVRVKVSGAVHQTRANIRAAFLPLVGGFQRLTHPGNGSGYNGNGRMQISASARTAAAPMVIAAPPPVKPMVVRAPTRTLEKPTRIRKRRHQKHEQVKLVGAAEHRCPYCLEEIDLNDPRGVKICPICKSYHHADCWDVTGMCQVPHHQE